MLARRNLSLGAREQAPGLIVRHEQFTEYQAAVDVMSQARADADALLLQAENLSQESMDRALADFWGKAGCFLEALEAERQHCRIRGVEVCQDLLDVVIGRLFDECQPKDRARVLLEQLMATQASPAGKATLRCHPALLAEVQTQLETSSFSALWQLHEDSALCVETLRLSTDTGEYDIDWKGLRRSFQVTRA